MDSTPSQAMAEPFPDVPARPRQDRLPARLPRAGQAPPARRRAAHRILQARQLPGARRRARALRHDQRHLLLRLRVPQEADQPAGGSQDGGRGGEAVAWVDFEGGALSVRIAIGVWKAGGGPRTHVQEARLDAWGGGGRHEFGRFTHIASI